MSSHSNNNDNSTLGLSAEPSTIDKSAEVDAEYLVNVDGEVSPFTVLPTELLIRVLALLPTASLCHGGAVRNVCRRWREAAACHSIWRHRRVSWSSSPADRAELLGAVLSAPELAKIVFERGVRVPQCVLEGHSRVRSLSLKSDGVFPSEAMVLALLRRYSSHAEAIHLDVVGVSRSVSTQMLHLLSVCRSLRTLRLCGDLRLTEGDPTAQTLLTGFNLLHDLDVKYLDNGRPSLLALLLSARGQQLKRLILPGRDTVLPHSIIQQVAASCGNLVSFGADYVDAMAVIGHLPNLKALSLWFSYATPSQDALLQLAGRGRTEYRRRPRASPISDDAPRVAALLEKDCGQQEDRQHGCTVLDVLGQLEELTLELGVDMTFPAVVLGACDALCSLRLSGYFLERQLEDLLKVVPPSVTHFEATNFSPNAGPQQWKRSAELEGLHC